jgi:hypothetical protein
MEGFKSLPKMQHFKEGGSVQKQIANYEKRERKTEEKADMAQDKAVVKKAIRMHDAQEHKGEKTDLSKLRKGGRAKKELGSARKFIKPAAAPSGAKGGPNKYKAGGEVTNVYEAKKKSGDKDNIAKVKQITPTKATAESAPVGKPANTPAKFCGGKSVKKMADGRLTGPMDDANALLDPLRSAGRSLRDNVMGTPQQNDIAKARMEMIARKKAALMGGAGAMAQPTTPPPTGVDTMGNTTGMPMQKRGGKVKKGC